MEYLKLQERDGGTFHHHYDLSSCQIALMQ